MSHPEEAGVVLLEVLVALAILATAGLSLVALEQAVLDTAARTEVEENAVSNASRLLTTMTLLTRADLDRRIGRHEAGSLLVEVQRPERGLYRIAVIDPVAPEIETLVTVVYRPEGEP